METIVNRIKKIRKIKQRSLHDCAKLLGISREDYLKFEEGNGSISLPEIEILAVFLEIPPDLLFEKSSVEFENYSILNDKKMPIFKNLRNKMIRAQLSLERKNTGLSLEELKHATGIPMTALEAYEDDGAVIPIEHLLLICNHLSLPIESLIFQAETGQEQVVEDKSQPEKLSEDLENEPMSETQKDDFYQQMIRGMKNISERDQVDIAKMLIEKLKSL